MDGQRFDRLTKSLSSTDTRRGIIRLLSALSLGVTLSALCVDTPDATAEDDDHGSSHRRHRRKAKHRHQTGNGKQHRKGKRKGCRPKSDAKTCAGKCGTVRNSCGKQVDCGSCACDLPCPLCQTCDAATRTCVPIANRIVCAGSGSATSICCNGACCNGCCGGRDDSCGACRVFITSSVHTGALGGLSGADTICQTRAMEASLLGTYKAWISTVGVGGASPSTRFRQSQQPYRLVNGTQVAANWADLISPPIDAKINVTESGSTFPGGSLGPVQYAWTHTLSNGTPGGQNATSHCQNWMTTAASGTLGLSDTTTGQWTEGPETDCSTTEPGGEGRRLYCFQQD